MSAAPRLAPRSHGADLEEALATELRLLEELQRQLLAQRAAVAHTDAAGIDASVHASGRVLGTLEEARRRRRQLCLLLLGDADIPPAGIPDALGTPPDAALRDVVTALLGLAEEVARTIAVNRRVLQGALRTGQELIRVLHGEPAGGLVYERGHAAQVVASGALLNRRI